MSRDARGLGSGIASKRRRPWADLDEADRPRIDHAPAPATLTLGCPAFARRCPTRSRRPRITRATGITARSPTRTGLP